MAYSDTDKDHFYSIGEGQGGVDVEIKNLDTGSVEHDSTWGSGGYQSSGLNPGRYQVTARVGGKVVRSQDVVVNDQNVKVDFILSDPWQNTVPQEAVVAKSTNTTPSPQKTQATTPPEAPKQDTPKNDTTVTTVTKTQQQQPTTPVNTQQQQPTTTTANMQQQQQQPTPTTTSDTTKSETTSGSATSKNTISSTEADAVFDSEWVVNWTAWKAAKSQP